MTVLNPKQKCLTCSNRIATIYRFHSLYGKHDRSYDLDFCRFGIPIRDFDIRKCEKYIERLNKREER